MTDKKTFGTFIKVKRTEKKYSQKELADLLFVTEGAISKWERGVSYPDITLISDICRVLDVSEHELITASTDKDTRKLKHEARQFRIIRGAWFWVPTIAYAVALLTCFICNFAVNHTLSWFYIVLTALICAYTFIPTITSFIESRKLLAFTLSSFLSICLLLFTCAIYTGDLSWCLTACIGVLMGFVLLFGPILLSKSKVSRLKFIIPFITTWILTILLLLNVNNWHTIMLGPAILISCYGFTPAILCAIICALRYDAFLKTGICIAFSTVMYYFTEHIVDVLFGVNDSSYRVDLYDWKQCLEGNISFIVLISLLLISAVFIGIGISRICKTRKR